MLVWYAVYGSDASSGLLYFSSFSPRLACSFCCGWLTGMRWTRDSRWSRGWQSCFGASFYYHSTKSTCTGCWETIETNLDWVCSTVPDRTFSAIVVPEWLTIASFPQHWTFCGSNKNHQRFSGLNTPVETDSGLKQCDVPWNVTDGSIVHFSNLFVLHWQLPFGRVPHRLSDQKYFFDKFEKPFCWNFSSKLSKKFTCAARYLKKNVSFQFPSFHENLKTQNWVWQEDLCGSCFTWERWGNVEEGPGMICHVGAGPTDSPHGRVPNGSKVWKAMTGDGSGINHLIRGQNVLFSIWHLKRRSRLF